MAQVVFTGQMSILSTDSVKALKETRSHPEMVGDMSCVTLNFDISKIPFAHFYPGSRTILTPKIKQYVYWFSCESGYRC